MRFRSSTLPGASLELVQEADFLVIGGWYWWLVPILSGILFQAFLTES
jgi:hypothetical protein